MYKLNDYSQRQSGKDVVLTPNIEIHKYSVELPFILHGLNL